MLIRPLTAVAEKSEDSRIERVRRRPDNLLFQQRSLEAEVARGVSRLLIQEGFSPILEFTLPNGRRLDVAALGPGGEMLGVEIKVALADLRGDNFVVFSRELIPSMHTKVLSACARSTQQRSSS